MTIAFAQCYPNWLGWLWQPVDAPGIDEFLFFDLPVEEAFEFVDAALPRGRPLHGEHAQHAVNALQRQAVQVGQHANNVRPKHLHTNK